jgi:multiple sugar transport system permease protein
MNKYVIKKRIIIFGVYFVLIGITLFYILPILWVFLTSFQMQSNLVQVPPVISFDNWTQNYSRLLNDRNFLLSIRNSIIVSLSVTILTLIIAGMGAYALARMNFKHKGPIMLLNSSMQLSPAITLLIPLYVIIRNLNLLDTLTGLTLAILVFTVPTSMWLLFSFFKSIPKEMEEAAYIDGCKRFEVLIKIILPMSLPGILSSAIVTFIGAWGEFLLALPLTVSRARPLTVYSSSFSSIHLVDYGGSAACSILSSIPTIIIAFVFRRQLIRGLIEGAIKG